MQDHTDPTYRGRLGDDREFPGVVTRDGIPLEKAASLALWNHSPDGFSWGYWGSGPAQLSLALLLDAVSPSEARRWHQEFKQEVIAQLPQHGSWELTRSFIRDWWVNMLSADEIAEREISRTAAIAECVAIIERIEHRNATLGDAYEALVRITDHLIMPRADEEI
jgi:hypothetical protein